MFDVVAADDDQLPVAAEFESIDDVQAPRAVARASGGPDPLTEQEAEDVEDEQRGEQKRHDGPEQREDKCDALRHRALFLSSERVSRLTI
jgi:hypothetical protein